MPTKIGQNSFEGGLNTDVSKFNTPNNVLIEAKNVTQSTLAENQYILQNENGTAEVLDPQGNPVKLTEGYTPVAVEVYNNIAYIISVELEESSNVGTPGEDYIISERVSNGLSISYNFTTQEYAINGFISSYETSDNNPVAELRQTTTPPIPTPPTGERFVNYPNGEIRFGYPSTRVFNNSLPEGTIMAPVVWGASSEDVVVGYKTEIGTFPSPDWTLLNADEESGLQEVYSPIHNFREAGTADYIYPFRSFLGQNQYSEVDVELQQSFDRSVNIIFADGKNPIRLVNSRFKPSSDNPNSFIVADRVDLAARDTNVYSSDDVSQTNLIYSLSSIPTLNFDGVQESAGRLPEGNYKYYFKAVDADGNETSIIEESRTVSIFSGVGKSAHTSLSGLSSKATSFSLNFSEEDANNISGIKVYYSYFTGEFNATSSVKEILTTFRNKTDNSFSIVHTGLEPTEDVAISDLNIQYTPIDTAKTLSQVRSRLALAHVTYSSVDIQTLAEAAFRIRIEEEDTVINRDYSEVFVNQSQTSDMLYSTPEDIYGSQTTNQNPGIGYWREETYVCGVNWILENDYVTDSFPVKGIDRVLSPSGTYTPEDSDTWDYVGTAFKNTTHENRLGVYRTGSSAITDSNGHLIVKRLKFTEIDIALQYLQDAGIPVKGYFFTRKDRVKDCLWEGISGGLHRAPVLQNFQGSCYWEYTSGNDLPDNNQNRIMFLPALFSAEEDWENIKTITAGSSAYSDDRAEGQKDLDKLVSAGLKLVPSNGGWIEVVNSHVDGLDSGDRVNVDGSFIRDMVSLAETGAYDYRLGYDSNLETRLGEVYPDWGSVNRVAFHSADMLADSGSISRDFESNLSFEISKTDNLEITLAKQNGSIGLGGQSLVTQFYLKEGSLGNYNSSDVCKINATLLNAGEDRPVEEQFSAKLDRNMYKWSGSVSAYDKNTSSSNPITNNVTAPGFLVASGKARGDGSGGNATDDLGGKRATDAHRSLSVISTEYGSYFGCELLELNDSNTLYEIDAFNTATASQEYFSTRFLNYLPTITDYKNFGRYTKVYGEAGSLKNNSISWQSLYGNLSGTYKSITKRYTINNTDSVIAAEGDCFTTVAWKQLTRKRGLPNNITETYPTISTYYNQADTNGNLEEASDAARASTDIKASGPLAYTQGLYIPLIHQNNNNVAVRSIEEAEPTEKNLIGSNREFYPYRNVETLRARPQIESAKYNFGLNFGSDKIYSVTNTNVPAFTSEFSTRVVLSNATATSEFSNGYRTFQNINYKDYNQDFGSITKLMSFNNTLYCIQESAVSIIDVDGRTLTSDSAAGKVFIDSGDLLPSTLTNINSEYGSNMFNSIIKTDVGIFGVDYIKNRPWRITGEGLKTISDFKTQTKFNEFKDITKENGRTPVIKTHFDRLNNKVFFNYSSREELGFDQNLVYNTNTDLWIGEAEFTPSISFSVNDGFYSIPERYYPTDSRSFWKHGQLDNTSFYGQDKEVSIEFVLVGENPTNQKILENLKIASNHVHPIRYTYTVDNLVTYNRTGSHQLINPSFTEDAIVRGDIIYNGKGESFKANIMQANTQYKENAMDVQVGKQSNTSARIRDKAIKIKIVYDGTEKVLIQQVLSLYRESYA